VGSFSSAMIPALIALRERKGRDAMERVRANVLAVVVMVFLLAAVLLLVASPLVLRLLAADFGSEKLRLTQGLFMVLLLILPLSGLSTVWRAALNGEERFLPAALAPVGTPLLTIALLWIGGARVNIWMLAAAHLLGLLLELVWLAIAMRGCGLGLMPRWSGWNDDLRTVIFQHLPLVAVAVAANGGMLIDQSMAATLASGSVSALNYGTKLATVTVGVVGGALSTAALPRFSKLAAVEDWTGLRAALVQYAKIVAFAVLPATLLLIALSDPVVMWVFQRGAFTESAAGLVVSVQRWSLLQLPPAILAAILLRLISSFRANHLLMRVAAAALVLNLVFDVLLKRQMGVSGIALAGSLVQLVTAAYLGIIAKRRVPNPR
jgi:putative peptidoglycan lipid II flippase